MPFAGQHRRGVGEKGFHRGALGRPIEAADQDGPPRHVVVDRAGLEPRAGISGRQEDDGTSLGTRGKPTAIVGRVRRHQVGRGDQPALQAPHLEIVDRLRHAAQAAGGLDDAARHRDLVVVGEVDDARRPQALPAMAHHGAERPAAADAVEDDGVPRPLRQRLVEQPFHVRVHCRGGRRRARTTAGGATATGPARRPTASRCRAARIPTVGSRAAPGRSRAAWRRHRAPPRSIPWNR